MLVTFIWLGPDTGQLKGGRTYFGLWFQRVSVDHGNKGVSVFLSLLCLTVSKGSTAFRVPPTSPGLSGENRSLRETVPIQNLPPTVVSFKLLCHRDLRLQAEYVINSSFPFLIRKITFCLCHSANFVLFYCHIWRLFALTLVSVTCSSYPPVVRGAVGGRAA